MPGSVIGISLGLGYAGTPSRQTDNIIRNRINNDSANIVFGAPVILTTDNMYKNWASDSTAAVFAGVAVTNVKTNQTAYNSGSIGTGYYSAKEAVDVLELGSIMVFCKNGTPTAGGAVYIRKVAATDHNIGDFEAVADGTNSILIPNAKWTTGKINSDLLAEVTLLTRVNP